MTLGVHQAKFATERIKKLGLQDRCRVEVRDYRELADGKPFDKLSSIGLIEHLGPDEIPKFLRMAWKLLRAGGTYLNHHITFSATVPLPKWRAFTLKYVFPDGELQPISNTLRSAEEVGFEVRDVECRREHYAKTCDHWLAKLRPIGRKRRPRRTRWSIAFIVSTWLGRRKDFAPAATGSTKLSS